MGGPQQMPAPNMNMGGSAPVVAQPGVAAIPTAQPEKSHNSLMETVILVIVCLVAAAAIVVAVIFFMKWNELKVSHDSDVEAAVAEERATQQAMITQKIDEWKQTQTREWIGPADYGSVSFQFPKDWSVYVNKDGTNNSDYEVYFNPDSLMALNNKDARYALRFTIKHRQYDQEVKSYQTKVSSGKMTFSSFEADSGEISGSRFDGELGTNMMGSVVVFKINDKTVIMQTDTQATTMAFEKIIQTLRRNSN